MGIGSNMQKFPASPVALFAHILATYFPAGMEQAGLTHASICGPHLLDSHNTPSHVNVSPSGFMCCGGTHVMAAHAMGMHCSQVVMHERVSVTGLVGPTSVTQSPLQLLMQ
jgi:hypothetical protein